MKKQVKKLKLAKETVQMLGLVRVQGAAPSGDSCDNICLYMPLTYSDPGSGCPGP